MCAWWCLPCQAYRARFESRRNKPISGCRNVREKSASDIPRSNTTQRRCSASMICSETSTGIARIAQLRPPLLVIRFDGRFVLRKAQPEADETVHMTVGDMMHHLPYRPASRAVRRVQLFVVEAAHDLPKTRRRGLDIPDPRCALIRSYGVGPLKLSDRVSQIHVPDFTSGRRWEYEMDLTGDAGGVRSGGGTQTADFRTVRPVHSPGGTEAQRAQEFPVGGRIARPGEACPPGSRRRPTVRNEATDAGG